MSDKINPGLIALMRAKGRGDGLYDLVKWSNNYFNQEYIVVELGSYLGESTEIFAKSEKIKKVYAVDFWKNGYDNTDVASYQIDMKVICPYYYLK